MCEKDTERQRDKERRKKEEDKEEEMWNIMKKGKGGEELQQQGSGTEPPEPSGMWCRLKEAIYKSLWLPSGAQVGKEKKHTQMLLYPAADGVSEPCAEGFKQLADVLVLPGSCKVYLWGSGDRHEE